MTDIARTRLRKIFFAIVCIPALLMGAAGVFAQTVRIAVGTASVASLPTWVAADGSYFAREGLPRN